VAFITGGGSGIGFTITELLMRSVKDYILISIIDLWGIPYISLSVGYTSIFPRFTKKLLVMVITIFFFVKHGKKT